VSEVGAVVAYLRAALSHLAESVEIVDRDGRLVYVNPAWERLTGYDAASAIGVPARILQSEFHPAEERNEVELALASGRRWEGELIMRRKGGQFVFAHVQAFPVRGAGGEVEHSVVVRRDLNASISSIQKHGDRYAMALLASRDGLWDWDLVTGEMFASHRWREITGIAAPPADVPAVIARGLDPADHDAVGAEIGRFLLGADRYLDLQFRLVQTSGRRVHVSARAVALRDDNGEIVRLVGTLSDITERKRSEAELLHNATHDTLTGLANRALFVEQLRAAIGRSARRPEPDFGLLYIDLRRFKSINDAHGHAVGDLLLQSVATRLGAAVRPGDTVARLGGDEFAVLLDGVRSPAVAHAAAQRILRKLEVPHDLDGRSLVCPATIGVALGGGMSEVDQLVRSADTAMYDARRGDEIPVKVATPDAAERSKRNARLTDALRRAFDGDELQVAYQPIVDIASLRVVAVEALARWDSAEFGPVSPAEFVPLAEQVQLTGRLGQVVLERALRDLTRWEAAGVVDDCFRVHVNVSPRELLDVRLPGQLARAFAAGSVQPGRVCMEITETALVEHPEVVVGNIRRIRDLGITFALDDFGTGYSSLSHLRGFSVSSVKIDRSFVMQLPIDLVSRQIVRGLLTMTEALGLEVVAEGVEGPEHVSGLQALGCRLAQGYHYARPMPAADLLSWLASRQS
jgi:diguanylate cyclase (GGDEF)-like protein/PAS domain S-box-containing protein